MMVLTIYRRQLCGESMKSYLELYEYVDVIQLSVCKSVFHRYLMFSFIPNIL